jgi:hypothetical protein
MDLLETGRNCPPRWIQRIESVSRRVGQRIWVQRDAIRTPGESVDWTGPAYWSDHGDTTAIPPRHFGPEAVIYGAAPNMDSSFIQGVGYQGVWTKA